MATLTPDEQANVDAGLTTDGRPIEPCIHPDPDNEWWDDLGDDGQDSALASAWTGNSDDYSYLDDPEED